MYFRIQKQHKSQYRDIIMTANFSCQELSISTIIHYKAALMELKLQYRVSHEYMALYRTCVET